MKLYRLPFVLHSPSDETEDKYMAEIPALPGCHAWGDTPGQALEYLQSVATAFIDSYRERGDSLPEEVRLAAQEMEADEALGEVMVAG